MSASQRTHHQELKGNSLEYHSKCAVGYGLDLHGLHKSGKEFPIEVNLNSIQAMEAIIGLTSVCVITILQQSE
ncbi:hypothetical protein [Nitrosomonas supralitoralis]|uniref:Uncharacterized protein n=1 Tax=Nitrosomonas supralitoralis TaxID=2116706 RepID=A0A2P7NYC6_9PROT|nr:hypothetical protein [Nitrosomonas supralitoralis]PSJ18468.1 hypothetical protein C7H79_02460 [Nitrosomonas supralitoralis]